MRSDLRQRLADLLADPDPAELVGRGYRYTCARDPRKNPDDIKRDLGTAYVQRRRQEMGGQDISCVVSVRRWPGLRIARRA